MNCHYCARLSEENIRRAFTERRPLTGERIEMGVPWHDAVSPDGKPAVRAQFFCDGCGQTIQVVIELKGEPDPADWWKS
jgi:hypothetical protein